MPSLAKQSLLGRESVLDLALLFDNDAVARLLQKHYPDLAIKNARGHYLRYKPLTSCLVHYEVKTATGLESSVYQATRLPCRLGATRSRFPPFS
jgi:hypothetical protein